MACSNDGACHISRIIVFARPCTDCGILSSTLPALWNQQVCSSVPGYTSRNAAQNPNAPSAVASRGPFVSPRRRRSNSSSHHAVLLSR